MKSIEERTWTSSIAAIFGVLIFMSCAFVRAEVIELPDDELAQETVLPRFDHPESVRHRAVMTNGKVEVGASYGWTFTEPIYEQGHFNVLAGYHLSENSGLFLKYTKWGSGLNETYTSPLSQGNKQLDFGRAPKPQSSIYGIYEWKLFYGKISLTKQSVLNLHFIPSFGIGTTRWEHKSYYGALVGAGWKFYFSPSWGIRTSLKLGYSQAPSPFLGGAKLNKSTATLPAPGEFKDKWGFDTLFDLGLVFIF